VEAENSIARNIADNEVNIDNLNFSEEKEGDLNNNKDNENYLTDTCILPLVAVILSSVALAITLVIVMITIVNIITSE
jgi:hypothetical protein